MFTRALPRHGAAGVDDPNLPPALDLVQLHAELVGRFLRGGVDGTRHRRRASRFRRSANASMWARMTPRTDSGSMVKAGSIPAIFSRAFSRTFPADSAV